MSNPIETAQKKEMYLFVWTNVLTDYTSGMAFAIAYDLEEALNAINKKANYSLELPIEKMIKYKLSELKEPIGYYIYGGG